MFSCNNVQENIQKQETWQTSAATYKVYFKAEGAGSSLDATKEIENYKKVPMKSGETFTCKPLLWAKLPTGM